MSDTHPVVHDETCQAAIDDITDRLAAIADRGHTRKQVFEDWLDVMLYSFEGRDEPYLELVERYDPDVTERGPRAADADRDAAIDQFAAATGDLIHASRTAGQDVIGDVYTAFGQRSEAFAQFFTPHTVASAMAAMQAPAHEPVDDAVGDDAVAADTDDGDREPPTEPPADPPTIADPACGSGRLLVACHPHAPAGIYVGQDKDPLCAKMTAVNLVIFGLSGYAIHGDSLAIDQYRAWEIVNPPYGPPRCTELDPDDDPVPLSEAHGDAMAGEADQPAAADQPTETTGSQATSESSASLTPTTVTSDTGDSGDGAATSVDATSDQAGAEDEDEDPATEQVTLADLGGLTD